MGELEIEVLHRISIHALVKRATLLWNVCFTFKFNFNPRPREEGDRRCLP